MMPASNLCYVCASEEYDAVPGRVRGMYGMPVRKCRGFIEQIADPPLFLKSISSRLAPGARGVTDTLIVSLVKPLK